MPKRSHFENHLPAIAAALPGLPQVLTDDDLMATFRVSRAKIKQLRRDGALEVFYVGRRPRYLRESVVRFVAERMRRQSPTP